MGKQKFQVTKAVKKEIRVAVKGLPEMKHPHVYRHTRRFGHELLAMGFETANGVAIDPTAKYLHKENAIVNHEKQAAKEYALGGVLALTAYVVRCLEYGRAIKHEASEKQIENALRGDQ